METHIELKVYKKMRHNISISFAALVVRFLAKRFLPQYDGETDKTYSRSVNIEEKILNLNIIDKTGKVQATHTYSHSHNKFVTNL